jgi:hypothetical protein
MENNPKDPLSHISINTEISRLTTTILDQPFREETLLLFKGSAAAIWP